MRYTTMTAALALPATLFALGCAQTYEGEGEEEIRTQQRTVEIAEWDEDGDGTLDPDEFGSWFNEQNFFAEWDEDADDELTNREFSVVLMDRWDTNDDDVLSESEWNTGMEWFGEDADPGAWRDWDSDGDSELDANELHESLETNGLYDAVDGDQDAVFDDEEMADFFFDAFDMDDNDEVDTTEWDDFEL